MTRNNPVNFTDPSGLQVNNPGQGAAGLIDLLSGGLKFANDTKATEGFIEALQQVESTGEGADIFVDKRTGQVVGISPPGDNLDPNLRRFRVPAEDDIPVLSVPGFGPGELPACSLR